METREGAQSHATLCDPLDCSLPGSSIPGIFLARALEWVAISFFLTRGSNQGLLHCRKTLLPFEPPGKPLFGGIIFKYRYILKLLAVRTSVYAFQEDRSSPLKGHKMNSVLMYWATNMFKMWSSLFNVINKLYNFSKLDVRNIFYFSFDPVWL